MVFSKRKTSPGSGLVMSTTAATILEVNLISAQQLLPAAATDKDRTSMQTYVVAYININPKQKLSSRVDESGKENPTWNDKFIFVLDDGVTLIRPTSCIVFEIYQVRSFGCQCRFKKDKKIGVVHALLEDLMGNNNNNNNTFKAFQIRIPPSSESHDSFLQPILNIGVVTLNGVNKTVPKSLFGSNAALDYRILTGGH